MKNIIKLSFSGVDLWKGTTRSEQCRSNTNFPVEKNQKKKTEKELDFFFNNEYCITIDMCVNTRGYAVVRAMTEVTAASSSRKTAIILKGSKQAEKSARKKHSGC